MTDVPALGKLCEGTKKTGNRELNSVKPSPSLISELKAWVNDEA